MDKLLLNNIIDETLSHLKDFQLKTVESIYNKLYKDGESRHLIADEVGLGKTIVAKGLIAKILNDHLNNKNSKPLRVVYICSNQALASQNIRKLNILKGTDESSIEVGRLIFQAFEDHNNSAFRLTSLTPSTSFRLIRGSGVQTERLLIYKILSRYKVYTRGRRDNGLKLTLMGFVESPEDWKARCDNFKENNDNKIRNPIFKQFKKAISDKIVPNNKQYNYVYEELNLNTPASLQTILIKYSELFRVDNVKNYGGRNQILSLLRGILTEICLDYIEADLYILDEFQRFKDLIDTEGIDFENLTEASAIAKKIFNKKNAKVLMLSATPFKPYSTKGDDENTDDHFKEFKMVLKFLLKNEQDIETFKNYRKKHFDLLRRPEKIAFNDAKKFEEQLLPKYELEKIYRKVISRTERLIVSDDKNTLVRHKDKNQSKISIKPQDIIDFLKTDSIVRAINDNTDYKARSIINYVLSCPYPFSYLDQYKIKEILNNNKFEPNINSTLNNSKDGWINWDKIQNYSPLKQLPNGKMRHLLKESLDNDIWKQLWISPSLPYYELEGSFKDSKLSSKTLLFSKWVMVPKMIASMVSYEVERLTIGNKRALHKGEESRTYTPPMGVSKRQPRRPTKILALQMKNEKPGKMSAFSLLYPSILFSIDKKFHTIENIKKSHQKSLTEIKFETKNYIQELIDKADLKRYCKKERTTRNWYWAALVLLDKEFYPNETKLCLDAVTWNSSSFIDSKKGNDDEDEENELGASGKHFYALKKVYNDAENFGLGNMPDNLAEVLTEIALGSPAINFSRTLLHYFPDENITNRFTKSLDVASEFHSLFDKPEAIASIQLGAVLNKIRGKSNTRIYWRNVLRYCINGNLQSVLDEYGHLIYGDNKNIDGFFNRFYSTININTSNVKVDSVESFLNDKNKSMRCHYAVDFGNQNMDKEGGRKRITNILDSFNSPFRPFVLASTSVGQEGLDFHYYCRKIVHWNLPSNPIDFEQREGRINRYKGLVIRQNVVKKYKNTLNENITDIWNHLFEEARKIEGEGENPKPELVPYWHVEGDDIHIERIVPVLPYSKEISKLKHLLATLTLYRLTFGQSRQEELVDSIFKGLSKEEIDTVREKFMIDLSPISYLE